MSLGLTGKGSLIAFFRASAEAMGKRAHVYTSPQRVNFTKGSSWRTTSEYMFYGDECLLRTPQVKKNLVYSVYTN
jgi:hypothetical protein